MALAGVTIKVMPTGVEVDRVELKGKIEGKIQEGYGDVGEIRFEEEPVAFGLVALKFTFVIDEVKGTDRVDNWEVEGASDISVIDFRRALG
jgi:translation elongation factor aEF-1 beta